MYNPISQETHVQQNAGGYFHISSFYSRIRHFEILRYIIYGKNEEMRTISASPQLRTFVEALHLGNFEPFWAQLGLCHFGPFWAILEHLTCLGHSGHLTFPGHSGTCWPKTVQLFQNARFANSRPKRLRILAHKGCRLIGIIFQHK